MGIVSFLSQFQQVTWLKSCCCPRFFFFLVVGLDLAAGVLPALALAFFLSRSFRCQKKKFSGFLGVSLGSLFGWLEVIRRLRLRIRGLYLSFFGLLVTWLLGRQLGIERSVALGHLWSRSRLQGPWSLALASTLVAFLIRLSLPSCSWPSLSIHNFIKGQRPS